MTSFAVLATGDGLGFQAVFDACDLRDLDGAVTALAVEKKCGAVLRAEAAGVPVVFHPWGPYKVAGKLRATYDRDLAARLWMHRPDVVLLDGWERELTWGFTEMFSGRIIDLGNPGTPPLQASDRVKIVDFVRASVRDASPQARL
jgi:folate-dependent phosphoribosylglycinamide formyltransferase PurN